jgi:tetratricopeptide (TPR) repeat protein
LAISVKKLAVGAVRLAAMSQLGPLAGGLFLAGGSVAAKVLGEGFLEDNKWATASAEWLTDFASDKARELFGSAIEGFKGHDEDVEKSMQRAALDALTRLKSQAPAGFNDQFDRWRGHLTLRPTAEVFAGAPDLDAATIGYDDEQFRALWWTRMEPMLANWSKIESSGITQLHLNAGTLPATLAVFLRERLPEALQKSHEEILRDPDLSRSWIAFQQRVYRETLNQLRAIRDQLNRIEEKLDAALVNRSGGEIKAVWNIPLPILRFQNRPDLIDQIDHALQQGATALTAIHGLGGIGKTQLARAFAQQRRDQYQLGAWIQAETKVSVLASLSTLAPLLGVPAEQDQQAMAVRVMSEISARTPWLVIFDNAVAPEDLRPYVEQLTGNGAVVITSRNEQWDGLATPVSVSKWSIKESTRFLLERTKQNDEASAQGLAADLDGLALALEHAIAYMAAGDGMTLAEYRRVWREKLKWTAKGYAYPDSVAAALGLSLAGVQKDSAAAYDLLCLFAWLAPDRIPKKELLEAGASVLPATLARALANHDEWNDVIRTLGKYSLLARERTEGVSTGYYLHRIVQQVVRDGLANDSVAQWIKSASDLLDAAFPANSAEPEFWNTNESLLPHARALREFTNESNAPASLTRLANRASIYLEVRGLYGEAHAFQNLAMKSALLRSGDEASVTIYRSNLASILRNLGRNPEAREQIELALESELRRSGPKHRNVAVYRSTLANILRDLDLQKEARLQIETAIDSQVEQYGPDYPDVAVYRSTLASILRNLGELTEARKQIEMAIDSYARRFGPDHRHVAAFRIDLASILRNAGDLAEARRQIELALESQLKLLGPDHPHVGVSRSTLASILRDLGMYEEARTQAELALAAQLRQFGPDHPYVPVYRSTLADILNWLDKLPEAREQIGLAIESQLRQSGPEHAYMAVFRTSLAGILRKQGEPAEARKQAEMALELQLRQLGPDHLNVAVSRSTLAGILRDLGDYAEAQKQSELALDSQVRKLGQDNPHVALSRVGLAATLFFRKDLNGALREIDQALGIYRSKLPPGQSDARNAEAWREKILAAAAK